MHKGVRTQWLIPGVQHQGYAQLTSQMLSSESQQRLGRRLEQQAQKRPLIPVARQKPGIELVGQREDMMEVGRGQQVAAPLFHPLGAVPRLALRAMTIAAAVEHEVFMPAVRAPVPLTAEFGGSTASDVAQRLRLVPRQRPTATKFR